MAMLLNFAGHQSNIAMQWKNFVTFRRVRASEKTRPDSSGINLYKTSTPRQLSVQYGRNPLFFCLIFES